MYKKVIKFIYSLQMRMSQVMSLPRDEFHRHINKHSAWEETYFWGILQCVHYQNLTNLVVKKSDLVSTLKKVLPSELK